MAVTLNALTTGVGGLQTTGDTSGAIQLQSNGTATLTVDTSGNVGIATTSPATKLDVTGVITLRDATLTGSGRVELSSQSGFGFAASAFQYKFLAGDATTERMRIDSSGNLNVGGTGLAGRINGKRDAATSTTRTSNTLMQLASNASGADVNMWLTDSTSYNYYFGGYNGTAYVTVGNSGGVKIAAGATSWAADSDERLKNIKAPITNAIENLSTLRTVYGNYKTDEEDVNRLFLIAQDVQKVYPEAIDVYQDEDKTLGLRYQDLIPVLVAAIQEQQTIINDLKARITALEGAK